MSAVTDWVAVAMHERERAERAERRVRQLLTDDLTGLKTRHELQGRVQAMIDAGKMPVVAWVDLNRFKALNDLYGHDYGNQFLAAVGRLLHSCLRKGPGRGADEAYRWGGDEFVLVYAPPIEPELVTDRIDAAFRCPVRTSLGMQRIHAAVGVVAAQPGESAADVIRRADLEMYKGKER